MIRAASPSLCEFYAATYRQHLICATADTLQHYGLAVQHWSAVHGDRPISSVDSGSVLEFQAYLAAGRSAATVNSYSRPIKAMLRAAVDEGLLAQMPRVRRIPERRKSPLALTIQEFGNVLQYVSALTGEEGGYPAADWWQAVLLTGWESGLRYRALMGVRTIDLIWSDSGFFSQPDIAKDRKSDWYPLQDVTLSAIRKIYDASRELLFARTHALKTLADHFRRILDASGIYAPRGCGMAFHRLRRSKASYTELAGGDAQRALGHSARSVTERYLDPRIVGRTKQPPMPLPLPI